MSIVGKDGKNVTPGSPCIYQLLTGQVFYSTTAKEREDSFIFDADQTLNLVVKPSGKGRADLSMNKLSDDVFGPKQVRILKSAIQIISDCGRQDMVSNANAALSGIVLAGPGVN